MIGMRDGISQWFQLYYNAYTGEFYTDVSPMDPFVIRDIRPGSSQRATFDPSRIYMKVETRIGNSLEINLMRGSPFSYETRDARLLVNPENGKVEEMSFSISDAGSLTWWLRPFLRSVTETASIRDCSGALRVDEPNRS
jgi:hypothetical protein